MRINCTVTRPKIEGNKSDGNAGKVCRIRGYGTTGLLKIPSLHVRNTTWTRHCARMFVAAGHVNVLCSRQCKRRGVRVWSMHKNAAKWWKNITIKKWNKKAEPTRNEEHALREREKINTKQCSIIHYTPYSVHVYVYDCEISVNAHVHCIRIRVIHNSNNNNR